MRRSDSHKLNDIISQCLKELKLNKKLQEHRLINSWPDIVGLSIAKKTNNLYIKDKKLFVYLNSSVVRNELQMLKDSLVKRLNEHAGEELIHDIVLK
jgi:predicted nucleic acid-binding Zn ribbon protein